MNQLALAIPWLGKRNPAAARWVVILLAVGAQALTALPEVLRHVAVPLQQAVFGQVLLDPEVLRMLLLSLAMIFMMLLRPSGLIPAYSRYSRPELVVGKEAGR